MLTPSIKNLYRAFLFYSERRARKYLWEQKAVSYYFKITASSVQTLSSKADDVFVWVILNACRRQSLCNQGSSHSYPRAIILLRLDSPAFNFQTSLFPSSSTSAMSFFRVVQLPLHPSFYMRACIYLYLCRHAHVFVLSISLFLFQGPCN